MNKKIFRIGIVIGLIAAVVYVGGGITGFFKNQTAYAVGDLTVNWGVLEGNPIFTIANAYPGQSETRTVAVTNSSPITRPLAVRGFLHSQDASLSGVLDISITQGATTLYGPKTLGEFFTDSSSPDGIPLSTLASGASTNYDFKVLFKPEAGNEFQNKSIVFDLKIGVAFTIPAECGDGTLYGAPIFGTSGNDKINGGNGNDLIVTFEGNDIVSGGNGKDCIISGSGNNKIDGGNGNDVITSGNGLNKVTGGNGNDVITSGFGTDKIEAGNDSDTVNSGGGNDVIDGGNGNDKLFGEGQNDMIDGGNGKDTCEAEIKKKCEL